MKLLIRPRKDATGSGKIQITVPEQGTVTDLKSELDRLIKVKPNKQRLICTMCGVMVLMSEGWSLRFYNLKDGDTIYLETIKTAKNSSKKKKPVYSPEVMNKIYELVVQPRKPPFLQAVQAIQNGNLEELKRILESDVCLLDDTDSLVNQTDSNGYTLLHFGCYLNQPQIVKHLLEVGVKLNAETSNFWTPLQIASFKGHFECVNFLLQQGNIQINKMTVFRGTALHLACKANQVHIVKLLLDAGASMILEDYKGRIPLMRAKNQQILEMIPKYMGDLQLKKYGYQMEVPSPFGSKLYHIGTLTLTDEKVYLYLEPTKGTLNRYKKQEDLLENKEPAHTYWLHEIADVRVGQGGLFVLRHAYCFVIENRDNSSRYYTKHKALTQEWILRINEAIHYCQLHGIGKIEKPSKNRSKTTASPLLPGTPTISTSATSSTSSAPNDNSPTIRKQSESLEEEGRETVDFSSFTVVEELGSGSFGTVYKVIKNSNQDIFAMKSLSKQKLMRQKQLKYAINECKVLKQMDHPFIVNLHYAFQNSKYLYLVLEYCPNGDLSDLLEKLGRFTEKLAKFYMAETVLAIEYLHNLDIVYRDLKPANILLDTEFHIKLADFGLAKENVAIVDHNMTLAGSPAYLAPEIVARAGAGKTADIYGLGVLLYEFLTGSTPYAGDDMNELFHIITQGKLHIPDYISDDARECIKVLMHKNPNKRPSISQVKRMNFFKKVNWDALMSKRIKAPKEAKSFASHSFADEE